MIHHSSQTLDDSSVAHVRIKKIKQPLPQENEETQHIKKLQEGINSLQKDIDSVRDLIQLVLVQVRMEDAGLDVERNEKEQLR